MLQFHPVTWGVLLVVAIGSVAYNILSSGRRQANYTYSKPQRPFRPNVRTTTPVPENIKVKSWTNKSVPECCICCEDMDANPVDPKPVKRFPCEHFFHNDCIAKWLVNNSTCPLCRTQILGNRNNC